MYVNHRKRHPRHGFSLLELLVTVSILALISGITIVAIDGMDSRAHTAVTIDRLNTLKAAILEFERDTGYLPIHGKPFQPEQLDLSGILYINDENKSEGNSSSDLLHDWAGLESNFWQLFYQPIGSNDVDDHDDAIDKYRWTWKPSIKLGWNGPYLKNDSSHSYTDQATGLRRVSAIPDAYDGKNHSWYHDLSPFDAVIERPNDGSKPKFGRPIRFIKEDSADNRYEVYMLVLDDYDSENPTNSVIPPVVVSRKLKL